MAAEQEKKHKKYIKVSKNCYKNNALLNMVPLLSSNLDEIRVFHSIMDQFKKDMR